MLRVILLGKDGAVAMNQTIMHTRFARAVLVIGCFVFASPVPAKDDAAAVRRQAEEWRAEHRIIDLHQHIDYTVEHLARDSRIMDAVGLGVGVNLSGGELARAE